MTHKFFHSFLEAPKLSTVLKLIFYTLTLSGHVLCALNVCGFPLTHMAACEEGIDPATTTVETNIYGS